jgi:hypothetical protein
MTIGLFNVTNCITMKKWDSTYKRKLDFVESYKEILSQVKSLSKGQVIRHLIRSGYTLKKAVIYYDDIMDNFDKINTTYESFKLEIDITDSLYIYRKKKEKDEEKLRANEIQIMNNRRIAGNFIANQSISFGAEILKQIFLAII